MKAFKIAQPRTLDGAISSLEGGFDSCKILAGGTDLLSEMKERVRMPELLVNLKTVEGMRTIERTDRGLEIGALVTIAEVGRHADIRKSHPALAASAGKTATPQVRNVGTVGGNLCQRPRCWYYRDATYPCLKKGGELCYAREGENEYHAIFDNATCNIVHPSNLAPALMAYDARLEIMGPDYKELVPAEEFFVSPEEDISAENILAPDQVITAVVLPPGSESPTSAYFEAREKQSYDWALCASTVNLRLADGKVEDCRVVLSAVAPTPVRRYDLEDVLRGKRVDDALVDAVCEEAVKDATPLRDNGYKVVLVKATLRRAIRQAMNGSAR